MLPVLPAHHVSGETAADGHVRRGELTASDVGLVLQVLIQLGLVECLLRHVRCSCDPSLDILLVLAPAQGLAALAG